MLMNQGEIALKILQCKHFKFFSVRKIKTPECKIKKKIIKILLKLKLKNFVAVFIINHTI